jgi:hypothetical protein
LCCGILRFGFRILPARAGIRPAPVYRLPLKSDAAGKDLDERCHVTIALGTAIGGWTLSVNGLDGLALAGIGLGMLSLGLAGAIGDGQCSSCLRAKEDGT